MEAKDAAGWNLLHFAAKHQNEVGVEFASKSGLDPEEKVRGGLMGGMKEREKLRIKSGCGVCGG